MANLKDVIYLSAEDYNTLYTNGTVTINGVTLTYDANNVYIVPDNTQQQIDDILALIPSDATSSNKLATASDIPIIPTNVSAFNNDAGYLTSHQSLPFIGYIYVHYSQGQGDSNYCRLTNIMGTALSISTYSFANSNKEIRIQMSASKKYYVMITDQSAANYYNGTTNDNVNTDSSYNHSANASYYFKVQMNAAINTLRLLVIGI